MGDDITNRSMNGRKTSESRRPLVNPSFSTGTGKYYYDSNKRYCPNDGRLLMYITDSNYHICPECGYQFDLNSIYYEEEQQRENEDKMAKSGYTISASNRVSVSTDPGVSARGIADQLEIMKIKPLPGAAGMNRRQQIAANRDDRTVGHDEDFKKMAEKGYTFVSVTEHNTEPDSQTFSSTSTKPANGRRSSLL